MIEKSISYRSSIYYFYFYFFRIAMAETVFASTHSKPQKSPQSILQRRRGKTVGILGVAFIELGEVHASRTAAAVHFRNTHPCPVKVG